jgi:hypothetical protein
MRTRNEKGALRMNTRTILKDQSGTALVVALIMIVVLTLIGLASTFSSTFEISLSGNKRLTTDAFYDGESYITSVALIAKAIDDDARTAAPNDYYHTTDKLSPDDTNLTADEIARDLGGNDLTQRTALVPKKLPLPGGKALDDKAVVKLYRTKTAGGGGEGHSLESRGYIIDSKGTDQIVSSDKYKSTVNLRAGIVVHSPSADESQ